MFLLFLTLLLFFSLCLPQVIYKKFQIGCPLEEYSANSTASHLSFNLSSHDHGHGQEDDSHCSAYMFTMNSQVGSRGEDPVRLPGLVSRPYTRHSVPASGRSANHTLLCFLQTAYTIPILAFAFVCHPEVLPIYTELRKWVSPRRPVMFVSASLQNVAVTQLSDFSPSKARMQKVSNISIFVMYIMYFLAALFGYLTFKGKSMLVFFLLKN